MRCWGENTNGQLGDGSTIQRTTSVAVSGLTDAANMDAGYAFACAVRSNDTAVCWGLNNRGQLGNGTTTSSSTPVAVTGLSTVRRVTAGYEHACAALSDGAVRCWGANDQGQLGVPSAPSRMTTRVTPKVSGRYFGEAVEEGIVSLMFLCCRWVSGLLDLGGLAF